MAITPQYEAIIVGCGFGGMGAAIQLRASGVQSILMLDRADDLGGTWHLNSYPGLAVDIPSSTYSFSFELNPNWSRMYAPGTELKAYTQHVAEKYGLKPLMRFNTPVRKVQYDEAGKFWTVSAGDTAPLTARLLVLATGYLSQPQLPNIPGIESFRGKVIHTSAWDHGYDLAGKRAAVIGTGATAVQLLPEIAPKLAHLDVYQRTPIWVSAKWDPEISEGTRRLYARFPFLQRLLRWFTSGILELMIVTGVLFNRQMPGITRFMERECLKHLHRQIKDPVLREKLTPKYSFGCKRPTFSNSYYRTFLRPNVELVTDRIERIEPDGIVTADGRKRAIDTLVCATGFSLWEKNFPAVQVLGRNGRDLGAEWRRSRFSSYEGIASPGFPNLFNLPSPYSYNGLSFFTTIETQMKHMGRLLKEMRKRGALTFEPREDAQAKYTDDMRQRLTRSVFLFGNCASANSYYFDSHGDPAMLRPTGTFSAFFRARTFPLSDYAFE